MANNDDKRIYDSLANWLQDCFDDIKGHDDLNRFKKLGFDQELKNGKEWAESKKTLSKINNFFANNFGAYPTIVPMRNNEGWRIVYKPSNANELGLREDQWPSLEIEMSKDGATIHNTMWSPETAAYIRGKNGQVGLTSLPNAALRQVLNDLEAQEPSIKNVMNRNKKEGFQYLKSTVSGSIRDIKNLSPAIYSPNQLKEYDKLNQGNLKRKRLESTEAMKTMADYSNYVRSVYKSLDSKVKFQKTEKEFTRMVDDIITYSRYVKDITELQQVVQQNYNYIYKNAWFGELENFYKSIVGKVKQGTMTEGSVGKIMFSEPDVIASNFAKAGKKIGQNLQVFEQFSHFGKNVPTVARGRSNAFTKTQYAKIKEKIKSGEMDKDSVYKDLYEVAYISDLSLKKAYEEIAAAKKSNYDPAKLSDTYKRIFGTRKLNDKEFKAIQQAALKGFGNDAILISEGLADEFKEIKEFKRYKDNVVDFEEANEAIRKKLIKDRMNRIHSVKAPDKLKGKRLDEYTNYVKELEDLKKGKSIFELTANGSV